MKAKVILAIVALIATVGVVPAQNTTNQTKDDESRSKVCYVDTNKNGICDNYESGACKGCAVGKGQGQGLRDGSGKGKGISKSKSKRQGKGQRLRDGSCGGNGGKCANYVDNNNNGICDRRETVKK